MSVRKLGDPVHFATSPTSLIKYQVEAPKVSSMRKCTFMAYRFVFRRLINAEKAHWAERVDVTDPVESRRPWTSTFLEITL